MLLLSRKKGESIIIDGGITVTIHEIEGNQVRVAVSAPPDIRVDRQEIHYRWRAFVEECETAGANGEPSSSSKHAE